MAESKKAAKPVEPALAPGSESGDPAVHQLLARRDIAAQNGDEKAAQAATDELRKLGYR